VTSPVGDPLAPPTAAQWDAASARYGAYLDTPLGRLRDELAWRNARGSLPARGDSAAPPLVLDAGCGPGHATARLLGAGYRVHAVDPAPAMLDRARERVGRLAPTLGGRVVFAQGGLDDLPTLGGAARYDAILCHNVLEFVADPAAAIRALAAALRPGGTLSLLTLNRWSELLRATATGDQAAIRAALDRRAVVETMTGGTRRLNDPDAIRGWLADAGLRVASLHGVRLVADASPGVGYEELLATELAIAAQAPPAFAYVGRQIQFIARQADTTPNSPPS